MKKNNLFKRTYQKKFALLKETNIEMPLQGWIKTLREYLGMTTTQLGKRLGVSQPRIIQMEKNERNIKISTMERIADVLNCDFVYAFVPRDNIDDVIYNQAKKKAGSILKRVNKNMSLENQLAQSEEILEDIIKELLTGNIARIWDEDK
ncbi:mobile mystery protein A [bacterium]|nr:mobile mystery protein A [bacterium]